MWERAEPPVLYDLSPRSLNASLEARVRPTELRTDGLWRGSLLVSNLNHVINGPWLQWRGVTHVLCTVGKAQPEYK
eukprot:8371985-Lingulodinium_polyedra.AAC.1